MTTENTNASSDFIKHVSKDTTNGADHSNGLHKVIGDTWSGSNKTIAHAISGQDCGVIDFTTGSVKKDLTLIGKDGVKHAIADGAEAKVGKGDDLSFLAKQKCVDTPASALENAIRNAQSEAAQRVMADPRWENMFMRSIQDSERALRQHPNLADEIRETGAAANGAATDVKAKDQKISAMIDEYPKESTRAYLRQLVDSDPDSKEREILRKFYPELHQQTTERDGLRDRASEANTRYEQVARVQEDAVNSHLEYARFLNQRGGKADGREMVSQLADIARINPDVVNPLGGHPNFHEVRDMATNLKPGSVFHQALTSVGIDPDYYFNPKFDRPSTKPDLDAKPYLGEYLEPKPQPFQVPITGYEKSMKGDVEQPDRNS